MEGGKILWMIGGAVVGGAATRMLPQTFMGASNSGIMGYFANGAVALAGSWLVGKWNKSAGLGWLIGGGAAIALRIYQDYTTGAASAGASDGSMSLYVGSNFPIPGYTTGNPLALPPYQWAGAPTAAPAGVSPAAAAAVNTTTNRGPYSKRLGGRFAS